jgi:hypothetical protein
VEAAEDGELVVEHAQRLLAAGVEEVAEPWLDDPGRVPPWRTRADAVNDGGDSQDFTLITRSSLYCPVVAPVNIELGGTPVLPF